MRLSAAELQSILSEGSRCAGELARAVDEQPSDGVSQSTSSQPVGVFAVHKPVDAALLRLPVGAHLSATRSPPKRSSDQNAPKRVPLRHPTAAASLNKFTISPTFQSISIIQYSKL